jgi:hypothetical protein
MPVAGSARHRNGGQRVISVNTLFWKILVTRVNRVKDRHNQTDPLPKRKMREGKILRPLRELTAANSANQQRTWQISAERRSPDAAATRAAATPLLRQA